MYCISTSSRLWMECSGDLMYWFVCCYFWGFVFAWFFCFAIKWCCYLMQNVLMELSESTVSGSVTADWPVKCVISQQGNVSLVANLVLLALTARSVSFLKFSSCINQLLAVYICYVVKTRRFSSRTGEDGESGFIYLENRCQQRWTATAVFISVVALYQVLT